MLKQFASSFVVTCFFLLSLALAAQAYYDGSELSYLDYVTVNGQKIDNFDEQPIVFYLEDLRAGAVIIQGLLEAEQKTIPVTDLQVEISMNGGKTWKPAEGNARWRYKFYPAVGRGYDFSIRVVQNSMIKLPLVAGDKKQSPSLVPNHPPTTPTSLTPMQWAQDSEYVRWDVEAPYSKPELFTGNSDVQWAQDSEYVRWDVEAPYAKPELFTGNSDVQWAQDSEYVRWDVEAPYAKPELFTGNNDAQWAQDNEYVRWDVEAPYRNPENGSIIKNVLGGDGLGIEIDVDNVEIIEEQINFNREKLK